MKEINKKRFLLTKLFGAELSDMLGDVYLKEEAVWYLENIANSGVEVVITPVFEGVLDSDRKITGYQLAGFTTCIPQQDERE